LVWLAAQAGTALGVWLGAELPAAWSLEVSGTLVFLALLVVCLKTPAARVVALLAGSLTLAFAWLPWRLGLPVACVLSIGVGLLVRRGRQPCQEC